MTRILMYDLECAPANGDFWGLFDQNIGINQVKVQPYILSFAARWYGSKKVIFKDVHHDGRTGMLEALHAAIDEADAVCGWNSTGFDDKWANGEFAKEGMAPPSPVKKIDLMLQLRAKMRFLSNKLDYVSQEIFGLEGKKSTGGHELWTACMAGDETAWRKMKSYNIQDVNLLVDIFDRALPWLTIPNPALHDDDISGCPRCGSDNYQSRGSAPTATGRYPRFQCNECGGWFKGKKVIVGSTTEFRAL